MNPSNNQSSAAILAASRAGEYLSFRLGAEEYGIEILKVQEIRGFEPSTKMINAPAYVLGVVNLRGVIVPILDMRLNPDGHPNSPAYGHLKLPHLN